MNQDDTDNLGSEDCVQVNSLVARGGARGPAGAMAPPKSQAYDVCIHIYSQCCVV
jgi:hypothetical protein